jgi:ribosome-associated protein
MMIEIPKNELSFTFARSSGPGGQNVNKVNTKAIMTWDMESSINCFQSIKDRFSIKYKRLLVDQYVVISSQKYRTQNQNIEDCISKLHEYLSTVEFPPKSRRPTKPSRNSVKKRLDTKSKHSAKKRMRSEKFED